MDACTAYFVLSAVSPQRHRDAVRHLASTLKVGASLCFRDYAQGDIAQLRAEDSGVLTSKSHVRPDLTLSYYFSVEEVRDLFSQAGLEVIECEYHTVENHNRKKGTSLKRAFVHALGRVGSKAYLAKE
jgi:methyltransferase-like protein 6